MSKMQQEQFEAKKDFAVEYILNCLEFLLADVVNEGSLKVWETENETLAGDFLRKLNQSLVTGKTQLFWFKVDASLADSFVETLIGTQERLGFIAGESQPLIDFLDQHGRRLVNVLAMHPKARKVAEKWYQDHPVELERRNKRRQLHEQALARQAQPDNFLKEPIAHLRHIETVIHHLQLWPELMEHALGTNWLQNTSLFGAKYSNTWRVLDEVFSLDQLATKMREDIEAMRQRPELNAAVIEHNERCLDVVSARIQALAPGYSYSLFTQYRDLHESLKTLLLEYVEGIENATVRADTTTRAQPEQPAISPSRPTTSGTRVSPTLFAAKQASVPPHVMTQPQVNLIKFQAERKVIEQRLDQALQYGSKLCAKGKHKANELIMSFDKQVRVLMSEYFTLNDSPSEDKLNEFKQKCDELIADTRSKLKKYPDTKHVLKNIALAIAMLGVGYLIVGGIKRKVKGQFTFGNKNSVVRHFKLMRKELPDVKMQRIEMPANVFGMNAG